MAFRKEVWRKVWYSADLPLLARSGEYDFPIVGESHYQKQLSRLAGGKTEDGHSLETAAQLIPEPENRHDENAVMVSIGGVRVGHLSRDHAVEFVEQMRQLGHPNAHAICSALICGGWDRGDDDTGHFGVKLDIDWPVAVVTPQA